MWCGDNGSRLIRRSPAAFGLSRRKGSASAAAGRARDPRESVSEGAPRHVRPDAGAQAMVEGLALVSRGQGVEGDGRAGGVGALWRVYQHGAETSSYARLFRISGSYI